MDNQKVENVSMNPNTIPEPVTNLKKRKTSKNIFKVALFMMRARSSKKSKMLPVDDQSKSVWRKLLGSMRPMHLQSNRSPPQAISEQNEEIVITENSSNDNIQSEYEFDSVPESPNSPSPDLPSTMSSRYASAVGLSEMVNSPSAMSSRYASAVGLSEMANLNNSMYASAVGLSEMVEKEEEGEEEDEDDDESENENEDIVGGDEMIDAKADEFIAQFYQQMKLQRMNIVDPHYKKISMRSLGL